MDLIRWFDLQMFADGAGPGDGGAGDGADGAGQAENAGVLTGDAARSRLAELGVPQSRLSKKRQYRAYSEAAPAAAQQTGAVKAAEDGQAAADNKSDNKPQKEDSPSAQPRRLTWDEIKADPEYAAELNRMMRGRIAEQNDANARLDKLAPVLQALGGKHGIDASDVRKMDIDALAKAVEADPSYYSNRADELGVDPSLVPAMDELDRLRKEKAAREQQDTAQRRQQERNQRIAMQAVQFSAKLPGFDLRAEMQNQLFRSLVMDNGLSVENAYNVAHHAEIVERAKQAALQEAQQKMASAQQVNSARPVENGSSSQGSSVGQISYKNMSKQQREAVKKDMRLRAARGEIATLR